MWNGNIKYDDSLECTIKCKSCGYKKIYNIFVERDENYAHIEVLKRKKESIDNINVNGDYLEIDDKIHCESCGKEIKINGEIKFNYK